MSERAGWPEFVVLDLHGFAQGGDAVGRWEGRPVFARGGIAGERVRVQLTERKQSLARGQVVEILSASPARTAPPGYVDEHCIGCDWHHIAYEAQLAGKTEILRDQLIHLGRIAEPTIIPAVPSAPWGYRSTARLHVAGTRIGYYAPGTRQIVALESSSLHHPLLNSAIATLLPLLPLEGLREVTLRASVSYAAVTALLAAKHLSLLHEPAGHWRQTFPALTGVSATTKDGWRVLSGTAYLYERFNSVRLRLSPTSFFQANVAMAQAMLNALRQALDLRPGERLLDAYCGVGTFILPLARGAELDAALGIEENAAAIEDARTSAAAAGLDEVGFFAGPVEKLLPQISKDQHIDVVLLDPPRRGVDPQALQALIALHPTRIAYVSCHPGTLARDIRVLTEAGYRLRFAQVFDFFPQTSHVESLALLDWPGDRSD